MTSLSIVVAALNPIAFQLGPIQVHWYGVIIASGVELRWFYLFVKAKEEGSMRITFMITSCGHYQSQSLVHDCIMWSSNGCTIRSILKKLLQFGMVESQSMVQLLGVS